MFAVPNFRPVVDRAALDVFLREGFLTEHRTWLEHVEVLDDATVLTWDCRSHRIQRRRYWAWSEVKVLCGKLDERELIEELGRRFVSSVERRCTSEGRIGLGLSGGLDSRAILAAIPPSVGTIQAVTFGRHDCDDALLAARVARLKGAMHQVFELGQDNWLGPRFRGVWWSDGECDMRHMHHLGLSPRFRALFDIELNGYLGDATIGGSYLDDSRHDEVWKFRNRGRRFILLGPRTQGNFLHVRFPFWDNRFLELAISIPPELRARSRIYNKMLLKTFPSYYNAIPWEATGAVISSPEWVIACMDLYRKIRYKASRAMELVGLRVSGSGAMTDYSEWIRREPARTWFGRILRSSKALYPEFIPSKQVHSELDRHMAGEDFVVSLFQYLTFETWLQQVFEGRWRRDYEPISEAAELAVQAPPPV